MKLDWIWKICDWWSRRTHWRTESSPWTWETVTQRARSTISEIVFSKSVSDLVGLTRGDEESRMNRLRYPTWDRRVDGIGWWSWRARGCDLLTSDRVRWEVSDGGSQSMHFKQREASIDGLTLCRPGSGVTGFEWITTPGWSMDEMECGSKKFTPLLSLSLFGSWDEECNAVTKKTFSRL